MVYVTDVPAEYVPEPSLLLTCRSATGAGASVSGEESSLEAGSVVPAGGLTVAVLTRSPVKPEGTSAVTVKVTVAPEARSIRASTSPVPEATTLLPASRAAQATFVSAAGR